MLEFYLSQMGGCSEAGAPAAGRGCSSRRGGVGPTRRGGSSPSSRGRCLPKQQGGGGTPSSRGRAGSCTRIGLRSIAGRIPPLPLLLRGLLLAPPGSGHRGSAGRRGERGGGARSRERGGGACRCGRGGGRRGTWRRRRRRRRHPEEGGGVGGAGVFFFVGSRGVSQQRDNVYLSGG